MTREKAHEELIELFEDYPVSHKYVLRLIDRIFNDIENDKKDIEDDHY